MGTKSIDRDDSKRLMVFAGTSSKQLGQRIADRLGIELGDVVIKQFSDGEVYVRFDESIRGADVFVIQSTSYPTNDHLMELLIIIDALRRSSARRITAVIPYFGYARQDRKPGPRTPISAKLVANLITTAGASRVLSVDLHAGQIQGFFDKPVDHLTAMPVIENYVRQHAHEPVIVSPPSNEKATVPSIEPVASRLPSLPAYLVAVPEYR
mgnify:CR=1 FL=1